MFGNTDAGFLEALRRSRRRSNGSATRLEGLPETTAVSPREAFARKERYFAMASAPRWNL